MLTHHHRAFPLRVPSSIQIIHFSPPSYWSQLLVLQPPPGSSNSPVSTIAWAPSCGRSFHLIASGSRDGVARIWKVHPPADSTSQWEATLAAEITDHVDGSSGGIGRVEWNVTGTVLSTAGCDGVVRLWKGESRTARCFYCCWYWSLPLALLPRSQPGLSLPALSSHSELFRRVAQSLGHLMRGRRGLRKWQQVEVAVLYRYACNGSSSDIYNLLHRALVRTAKTSQPRRSSITGPDT